MIDLLQLAYAHFVHSGDGSERLALGHNVSRAGRRRGACRRSLGGGACRRARRRAFYLADFLLQTEKLLREGVDFYALLVDLFR